MTDSLLDPFDESANQVFTFSTKLTIVDLAGAERNKRTTNNAARMRESNSVNLSLSALRRCFVALKKKKRVPFRENKLTHFLKEYFHDDKQIQLIINLNPSQADFEESLQVLEYGSIARKIELIKSTMKSKMKAPVSFVGRQSKHAGNSIKKDKSVHDNSVSKSSSNIKGRKYKKKENFESKNVIQIDSKMKQELINHVRDEVRQECIEKMRGELKVAMEGLTEMMNQKLAFLNNAVSKSSSKEQRHIINSNQINIVQNVCSQSKNLCSQCRRCGTHKDSVSEKKMEIFGKIAKEGQPKKSMEKENKEFIKNMESMGIEQRESVLGKKREIKKICSHQVERDDKSKMQKREEFFENLEERIMAKLKENEDAIHSNRKKIKKNTKKIRVKSLLIY